MTTTIHADISGYISREPNPVESWSVIRAGTGNNISNGGATLLVGFRGGSLPAGSDKWMKLQRGYFSFPTTTLSGLTIISGVLRIYNLSKTKGTSATPTFTPVLFTPSNPTSPAMADFQNFGSVAFATPIAYADILTGESNPNDFTLNTAAITAINSAIASGRIGLGIREASYDISGAIPPDNYYTEISNIQPWGYTQIQNRHPELILETTAVSVTTDPATNLTGTSAQLNGTLINTGAETGFVSFEWGLTTGYGNETLEEGMVSSGTFYKVIGNNLIPGTTYHFRARARIGSTYVYGIDRTFNSALSTEARVTSLTRYFSAGPNMVYQLDFQRGGMDRYILPTYSRAPVVTTEAADTQTPANDWKNLTLADYGKWLQQHSGAEQKALIKSLNVKSLDFKTWAIWYADKGYRTIFTEK